MIIDKNINPERDLYYLGGLVIDILQKRDIKEVDYMDLYSLVNKKHEITLNLYSLTLDWLFILGVVVNDRKGKIIKCF